MMDTLYKEEGLPNMAENQQSCGAVHFAVYLQNGQRVYFLKSNWQQKALNPPPTTLTAFFALCQNDPFAKNCCILKCLRIERRI